MSGELSQDHTCHNQNLGFTMIKYIVWFSVILIFLLSSNLVSAAFTCNAIAECTEQIYESFTQTFNSLTYNITAVAQTNANSLGPAYFLNGMTSTANGLYWYQVGLAYNVPNPSNGLYHGFHFAYDVFGPAGEPLVNQANITLNFSSPGVYMGDKVQLKLYPLNGNIIMNAIDITDGATAQEANSAYGANSFVDVLFSSNNPSYYPGYWTGPMTEQNYYSNYLGGEQQVAYANSTNTLNSTWLVNDESPIWSDNSIYGSTYTKIPSLSNSFNSLSYNGTFQQANSIIYITGNYPLSANAPTVIGSATGVYRGKTIGVTEANGTVISMC